VLLKGGRFRAARRARRDRCGYLLVRTVPTEGQTTLGIEESLPSGYALTTVEAVAGWARRSSMFPAVFGLACCAMEVMATGGATNDLARWGMEYWRGPRQADLMIVSGRVSQKMAPVLRRVHDQMPDPKWVVSMGVCASSGGMFNNYAVVQGVDHIVPVDIYLPGCPPRPQMLIDAVVKLHEQIRGQPLGVHRAEAARRAEEAALRAQPLLDPAHLHRLPEHPGPA